jgi:hypothetical protein
MATNNLIYETLGTNFEPVAVHGMLKDLIDHSCQSSTNASLDEPNLWMIQTCDQSTHPSCYPAIHHDDKFFFGMRQVAPRVAV